MSLERARELRRNQTPPERRMWAILHPLRPAGMHWRRQVPIGPYFADFACHEPPVVIEVDGDTHAMGAGPAHDARRDAYLAGRGYLVLRFFNSDVLRNPGAVFDVISARLAALPTPTPDPSPQGGGRYASTATRSPSPLRGGMGWG